MAIDTGGDIPDKVIADIPHGASAPGGALTRRPSETVKTYDGLNSLLPGRGEAAAGVHFIHYDGASGAGGRRKGADEPYAADKWTESIDLADITDDSMRLYLMEIGRVNLLTKPSRSRLSRGRLRNGSIWKPSRQSWKLLRTGLRMPGCAFFT